jgi:hypothetical protein
MNDRLCSGKITLLYRDLGGQQTEPPVIVWMLIARQARKVCRDEVLRRGEIAFPYV